jgi:hypothetical protein
MAVNLQVSLKVEDFLISLVAISLLGSTVEPQLSDLNGTKGWSDNQKYQTT